MKPSAQGKRRAVIVLTLALLAMASQPLVAADQTIGETGGTAPVFVGIWTAPGTQVVIVLVPLPTETPRPADGDKDKNGVILEDGAPF